MILAGMWQDRKGPRVVASVGGVLLGTGCLLASLIGDTVWGLVFAYGILGGFGVGLRMSRRSRRVSNGFPTSAA